MTKLTLIFTLIFTFYSHILFGAQIKEVVDGSELALHISNRDLNRIKVIGDKILSLKYPNDDLTLSAVDELGEVYIRPSRNDVEKIAVFVITEKGYTYKLTLLPKNISSTQIILKNNSLNSPLKEKQEIALDTTEKNEVLELIKFMRTNTLSENSKYKIQSISGTWFKSKKIIAKKALIYQGEAFTGLVLTLKNKVNDTLHISEKTFFKKGVRAVSLETNTLDPKSEINLYIVLN